MNMKELDVESALFDCKFELIVQENSFDIVDKPAEQGYKFNLKWINFDHPGCEAAKLRIVRTKFRDDPLSASKQYDHITVMDSHNEVWLDKDITLGTVSDMNDMINYSIEEFGDDWIVI